jgi:hypothetical protein
VKSAGALAAPVSPLVRAPFDRQRDTLKLARMGNADCKRLWNSFAEEAPGLARLVVADVDRERAEDAAATEKVDARLREAERLVVTKAKKSKRPKLVTKAARKAAVPYLDALAGSMALWMDSPDPSKRAAVEAYLSGCHG